MLYYYGKEGHGRMRIFNRKPKEPDQKKVHCYVCSWTGMIDRSVVQFPCPDCKTTLTVSIKHKEYGMEFDQ